MKSDELFKEPKPSLFAYLIPISLFLVVAAGIYFIIQDQKSRAVTQRPRHELIIERPAAPVAPSPITELADGSIVYKSKLYVPATSSMRLTSQAPAQQTTRTASAATAPARVTRNTAPQAPRAPAPKTVTVADHEAAARAYALDYFRFKSDLAKNAVSITASVSIEETKEVPNWSRYESRGVANITYATSQGGFRTVSRKFDAYTEERNGRAHGIDITVRF